jgi:hypothetical protein
LRFSTAKKATWEIKGAKIMCILRLSIAKKNLEKIKRKIRLQYVSSIFLIKRFVAKVSTLGDFFFFQNKKRKKPKKSVSFRVFFSLFRNENN